MGLRNGGCRHSPLPAAKKVMAGFKEASESLEKSALPLLTLASEQPLPLACLPSEPLSHHFLDSLGHVEPQGLRSPF